MVRRILFTMWCVRDKTSQPHKIWHINRSKFDLDCEILEKSFTKFLHAANLHKVSEMGPTFGNSIAEKTKSDVGNMFPLSANSIELIGSQPKCNETVSSLNKFKNMKRLQTNIQLQNKNDYFRIGQELFETFTSNDDYFAQMFPAIPNQQYIHLQKNTNRTDSEIKIYRNLEQLKGKDFIVMHGLKYTHYQYRMWFVDHEPSKCANKKQQPNCKKGLHSLEGKNDFVVLGPNYIAMIEVKKESSIKPTKKFVKTEPMQADKLLHVIKGIADATLKVEPSHLQSKTAITSSALKPTSFKVFSFVAFPRKTNRSNIDQIYKKQRNVGCIFDDDLDNFKHWWNQNITDLSSDLKSDSNSVVIWGDFEKVKAVLWTLWATECKTFDGSLIGFKQDLIATDKLLKDSEHTFTSKTRLISPNVLRTKDLKSAEVLGINIFHDILGIKYISKEQKQAFENQSRRLIITGCAGSGKSLMLLARFLYQAITNRYEKMILLVLDRLKLVEYKKIFEKLELSSVYVSEVDFDTSNLWQSRISIINCNLLNEKTRYLIEKMAIERVIYVDDPRALGTAFESLKCTCITIDFNLFHLPRETIDKFEITSLTQNFRSTWNIVLNLDNLSKAIQLKDSPERVHLGHPHHPSHGHLIHGPQTEIEVIHFDHLLNNTELQLKQMRQCYLKNVLRFFLSTETNFMTYKYFLIFPNGHLLSTRMAQEIKNLLDGNSFPSFTSCEDNIETTEIMACFILLEFTKMDKQLLRSVYNVISRARVFCNIMIRTNEYTDHGDLNNFLDIFNEAKICHIGQLGK